MTFTRRDFLRNSGLLALSVPSLAAFRAAAAESATTASETPLPAGSAPAPLEFAHFPDRLHAFVWRNWTLVPVERMAAVIGAEPDKVRAIARSMGLPEQPPIPEEQVHRSYITVIRRNWHLLPYEQLLELLNWSPAHMAYMLREDDFLYVKLGSLKPKCDPIRYSEPDEATRAAAGRIAGILRAEVPDAFSESAEPLFAFVRELASGGPAAHSERPARERSRVRFCYSYFALYGDPLFEEGLDPYPDGLLQKLADTGVTGVWLQAVLHKLAPFPWIAEDPAARETRLRNLRSLTERAARHGIGVFLYLNEPRAMPLSFYERHPELKGAPAGDHASLCTSRTEVREVLRDAVARIAGAAPELAGFFTITASENHTNCWSHGNGAACPRCSRRSAAEVIAEVNATFHEGIRKANSQARLIAWDWGWRDDWAPEIIRRLPDGISVMSVSEWSIPIRRGGVESVVGEYSISTIGPGPRAKRHWELARERGLSTVAKIQAGNTWELAAVPYIPAVENVATHVARLRKAGIESVMLGWTLGGYPSPNLQVACDIADADPDPGQTVEEIVENALHRVAEQRFGTALAPAVVQAWREFSAAFREFPYHGGVVYNAPLQAGPSNLLWARPTGYRATMVGLPYDDLHAWRQVYPPETFIAQLEKVADGFDSAMDRLRREARRIDAGPGPRRELERELNVAAAAAIHFRSVANQARYVWLRDGGGDANDATRRERMKSVLRSEIELARRLHGIQRRDSRIGFEATNHYFYVPQDLLEKIINCRYLLDQEDGRARHSR